MNEKFKIKDFRDLIVWQKGHKAVLKTYQLTKQFPQNEVFGLSSQLRRAIVGFTSDIAEGFSRSTGKDKIRFYFMALGSLTESQNQLLIAKDLNYINQLDFDELFIRTVELHKMTNSLIKNTRIIFD